MKFSKPYLGMIIYHSKWDVCYPCLIRDADPEANIAKYIEYWFFNPAKLRYFKTGIVQPCTTYPIRVPDCGTMPFCREHLPIGIKVIAGYNHKG